MRRVILSFFSFVCIVCAAPSFAHASVFISEVMYDVSGSDTDREWIEIANDGTSAVDVSGYRFYENTTNHPLTLLQGTGVLPPQGAAVIVLDQAKFLADNPTFSGTMFRASFSLSNTGETLGIKDSALALLDSMAYDAMHGASGNGESLHRNGNAWSAGATTPGVLSETGSGGSGGAQSDNSSDSTTTTTQNTTSPATVMPSMTLDAGGNRTVESGAGSFFEGYLFDASGIPMPRARYLWNFGDGETKEGQSVFYAYRYPGMYAVVLTADAGNGYSLSTRITVEAVAAEVSLSQGEDGSLVVTNTMHAKKELDLSLWTLERGGVSFVIPRGTIILPQTAVRFSPDLLKMPRAESAFLLYPSGMAAASTGVAIDSAHAGITYEPAGRAASVASKSSTGASAAPASPVSVANQADDAPIPSQQNSNETAAAGDAVGTFGSSPLLLSIAGLVSLLLIAIAGVSYVRLMPEGSGDGGAESGTSDDVDPYASADALAATFSIEDISTPPPLSSKRLES